VLNLLPRGTHEYEKFIRPSELDAWARAAGLELRGSIGLQYNPLTGNYWLSRDIGVNYSMHFTRPEPT
jgi:2-polyprenyl-6-hydroxyphenyl methylase/3-demethylubiquinone-9 3-methyltransferase